jgi:hypothetical protein
MKPIYYRKALPLVLTVTVIVFGLGISVAIASLTFTGSNITGDRNAVIDASGTISIGTSTATAINIGSSNATTTFFGDVGIGTTNPSQALSVVGVVSSTQLITSSSTITGLNFTNATGSSNLTIGTINIGTSTSASSALLTIATSSNIFTVLNNGKVGVGTVNPGAAAEIMSTSKALRLSYDSSTPVDLSVSSGGDLTIDASKLQNPGNTTNIRFKVSASGNPSAEVFTIKGAGGGTGLIGINNTSPSNNLDVNGTTRIGTNSGSSLYINNSSIYTKQMNSNVNLRDVSNISFGWQTNTQGSEQGKIVFSAATPENTNSTALSEVMRIVGSNVNNGGGYVGIDTDAPSTTLQVAGASSTIRIGTASLPGCLEMGNSDGSAGINYITVLNGSLSVTTTKPAICQ